jgi:hypothetical protein
MEASAEPRTEPGRVDERISRAPAGGALPSSGAGDPETAREYLEWSRANPAPLQEQILESQMVRRRRPMLVHDALPAARQDDRKGTET